MNKIGRYLASLPERTARAGTALAGGTIYEVSRITLPRIVRESRLYQAIVARMLRIAIELVGDVHGVFPAEATTAGELLARKAAGNVVELASVVTIGLSPLWLLAAAADVIGGSKAYLRTLVAELEHAKVLPVGIDISSYEDLLGRLEATSGVLADVVDVPPIRLADARGVLATLRQQGRDLPSPAELAEIFGALLETARRERRSPAEVSAAIGLAAARAGMELGNTHIFNFYRGALQAIADEGLLRFLGRITRPYTTRAIAHLDPLAPTYTDRGLDWAGQRVDQIAEWTKEPISDRQDG